jgi:hypothetical protein
MTTRIRYSVQTAAYPRQVPIVPILDTSPTNAKILALASVIGDFLFPESDHFSNDAEPVSQEFLIYQNVYFYQLDTTQAHQDCMTSASA